MPSREYTCSVCHGTFLTERPEADALMEYQEEFTEEMRAAGSGPPVVVCDVCYRRMKAEMPIEEAWRQFLLK